MGIGSVLIACLPSAITGFCFWCIEQRIQKQSKKLEKEENSDEKLRTSAKSSTNNRSFF